MAVRRVTELGVVTVFVILDSISKVSFGIGSKHSVS